MYFSVIICIYIRPSVQNKSNQNQNYKIGRTLFSGLEHFWRKKSRQNLQLRESNSGNAAAQAYT